MPKPDLEQVKSYVYNRLGLELPAGLFYHGIHHTRDDVFPAAERLTAMAGIDSEQATLLRTAVLYHDLGFVEQYTENEAIAACIAGETLPGFGYSPAQIETIQRLILATRLEARPENFLEEIIRDADLDSLGRENFFQTSHNLWLELNGRGARTNIVEWYHVQLSFLSNHRYHTQVSHQLRDAGKERNLANLRQRLARMEQHDSPPTHHFSR
jgi:uncharacterized protein